MDPIYEKVIKYHETTEYWILTFRHETYFLTHVIKANSKSDVGKYLKRYYKNPILMKFWYSLFTDLEPNKSSELVSNIHNHMQNIDDSLYDAIVEEYTECEGQELKILHKIIKSNFDSYTDNDLVDQIFGISGLHTNLTLHKSSSPITL